MSKYLSEFKLKVIEDMMSSKESIYGIARKYNLNESIVRRWFRRYELQGAKGLLRNNHTYDGNFKLNVVKYMHKNHLSLSETAIHFNLSGDVIVGKWERIYYEEGPQALFEERRGRSKNMSSKPRKKKLSKEVEEDLIAENQRLRMENAYLKKLQALVQERVKRENPKKHKPSKN